nr:hypothetical protein [Segatella copri]
MRRTIMMLFLFVMSIGIFAQESELEKKQREYRFATTEEKAIMDNAYTYDANSKYINKKINIPTKRNCSQVTRTYLSNHYSI